MQGKQTSCIEITPCTKKNPKFYFTQKFGMQVTHKVFPL